MEKDLTNLGPTQNTEPFPEEKTKDVATQALQQKEEELAAANDKYLRLYSDFENFRRRAVKEKLLLVATAGEELLKKLLPIVDDFERALEAMKATDAPPEATKEGIRLIHDKLLHLLQQAGVQTMAVEEGTPFDPEVHEAVTQVPTEDAKMTGKVIEVVEKGYLLQEKVLRFAKVVTGA